MATIELRQVEKKFGEVHAVKPMDLTIHDGEFVVLLGPSGCGKTTTLRMISGLEAVTGGEILLNGRNVTWAHPSERDIAFVFQFFALYSHLSVRQNIAFPLQAQGESKETVGQRVAEVASLLQIEDVLHQRPGALSGGDQQRVALARALVRRPAAFLMDEPLGALDADFRETMRAEIKGLHIDQHATTVYVTHDQIEAMAMGDRIVVMSNAAVQQIGTPAEVYHDPANLFVAAFIGSPGMNLLHGHYAGGVVSLPDCGDYSVPAEWVSVLDRTFDGSGEVILGFRPEAAMVTAGGTLPATVYASDLHGSYTMLHLNLCDNKIVHARSSRQEHYPLDAAVHFDLNPAMVRFFDPRTELALTREAQA
ncbi:ABC transporter ATP-binding protein [Aggregatilinea lenta]|uniref:ABC transporter ATP-binding protein n=1 Tax=Aggregatilinea lenta TaxID=913108 RepID=UPI000E5BFFCD|nr:ABC transporter ATP-binding protein [Aggregatilinea lenta]